MRKASVPLYQPLPKRHQADFYKLKMLSAERYADDTDIQQYTKYDMRDSSPQPAAQQPDDVEYSSEATCITAIAYHLRAKWRQYYQSYLKALQPERYAYDGKAQNSTADKIAQSTNEPAKDQPDDIA